MKLRNILLAAAAVTLCSSAYAAGAIAQGGTYVGLAGGWGSLSKDSQIPRDFDGSSSGVNQGGFSGRVYVGYLMSVNPSSNWLFGPELGYSYYANNTTSITGFFDTTANLKQAGYGVDALLNATYMFSNTFNVAVKPGFQYAFEKMSDQGTTWDDEGFAQSASSNKILPEINVEANWQVFATKPFYLGASYQYVWGTDGDGSVGSYINNGTVNVTSRDMFALNLEYLFN